MRERSSSGPARLFAISFGSADEFTGGPDELYHFADDAADNPTFYADLTRPQSLNKYNLGIIYRDGEGGPRKIKSAMNWLNKAARQGHKKAAAALKQLTDAE